MQAVIAGERVTKAEWANADVYLFLDGRLKIHKADGTEADLIVSDGDMRGSDWVVLLNH